jgi:ATP-binding cassette subfamily F protein uup
MPTGDVKLDVSEAQSSGKLVIEAINICKSFGSRKIVDQFTTRILRGDRLGIVGANGAGKTTLVNLLTGALQPDSGKLRLGAGLEMATLEQSRSSLKANTTLQDVLTGGGSDTVEINGERRHVIGYMKDFLFKPEQARTPIGKLSGGERGRLMLARVLAKPSNLLILDEPTNDLDLETLDLLEEMLADYKGTLILVSHDRDFLDRIATSTLMSEGSGHWTEYAGGYSDMVSQRGNGVTAPSNLTISQKKQTNKNIASAKLPLEGPPVKNKLTFNEQHALEQLPKKMEELTNKRIKLQSILDDSDLYKRDPEKFNMATQSLMEIDLELSAAEEKWLELEIKKESLGK